MSKNIIPSKASGNNFWYCSPLRSEKEPSFKVCRVKNVWYDYGTGTGGRLVDLICRMYLVDVPGSLLVLSGMSIEPADISFSEKQEDPEQESGIEIKHLQPLQNHALIQYLESRKINASISSKYLQEAYYRTNSSDKQYFSIAFANDKKGFELRNKYFKGSTSPKDITTIPGKTDYAVNCFEGFSDFLSALTWYKTDQPACDTIVLNGVGFVEKFIDLMPRYGRINLYLDNDNAGKATAKQIQDLRPDAINRSVLLYPKFKDFNEFIINQ
jgi:DNA primase